MPKKAAIVDLIAGGWYVSKVGLVKNSLLTGNRSFQALDSTGRVFVWGDCYVRLRKLRSTKTKLLGTMDGEIFDLQSDGFSIPQKVSDNPHQLQLPFPVRMLR